ARRLFKTKLCRYPNAHTYRLLVVKERFAFLLAFEHQQLVSLTFWVRQIFHWCYAARSEEAEL
ncbi:MAG: hypothetical protein ACO36H_01930, partial [Burkholderiaceae bacterium]